MVQKQLGKGQRKQIRRSDTFKKPRAPRSRVLPGLASVRSGKLDNLCEGIGDERAKKNAAVLEEEKLKASALQVMVAERLTVYRHAKVELCRIPGAEKLRVRLTKEEGDAGAEDLEVADVDQGADDDAEA